MNFDFVSLLVISLKSIIVYLFIIFAIRLFGKKELAQLSVFDLVFILLISNSVQNAMVGSDSSVVGGIAAATGLFFINYVFKWLLNKFPSLSKVVQGDELLLIYKGKLNGENFRKSTLTMSELEAAIREHGVEKISDVDLAVFEVDGNISVLSKEFQHKTHHKRKAHKVIAKNN